MTRYATEEEIREIEEALYGQRQRNFNGAASGIIVPEGAANLVETVRAQEEQLERQRSPALLRDLPVRSQPLRPKGLN